jgi:hypothetical protein
VHALQATFLVSGPEPGYVATPVFLVEAAREVLARRKLIADAVGGGGIFTPSQLLLTNGSEYVSRCSAAGCTMHFSRG